MAETAAKAITDITIDVEIVARERGYSWTVTLGRRRFEGVALSETRAREEVVRTLEREISGG